MGAKKNVGKIFEENWKKSIPDDVLYYRLKDSAQSFHQENFLRFSLKNPCDCFLFYSPYLFALELKSVSSTSISFEKNKEKSSKIIHYHQIKGLTEFGKYNNVIAGFLLNFRHKDGTQTCYYQHIDDFNMMINDIGKKSFNEKDLIGNNAIVVHSKKLRVNYKYDVTQFIKVVTEKEV